MAKRKGPPTTAIAIGVVAAVGVAGAVWMMSQGSSTKVDVSAPPPGLPEGRLRAIRVGLDESQLLAVDDLKRNGDLVDAVILTVGKEPTKVQGSYAFMTRRERIDCKARTIQDITGARYDAAGAPKTTEQLSGGYGQREATRADIEVAVACGETRDTPMLYTGWKMAQRELQQPAGDLGALVKADPQDAAAFAWLCSMAARGWWRKEGFADCDSAVKLAPGDVVVQVNRGFLQLKTGHRDEASKDFKAIIARDPTNAPALFGQSLILAFNKDLAGSKALRVKALAADPDIAKWIETRYRFLIGDDYRS
jgi:hypothetical protein